MYTKGQGLIERVLLPLSIGKVIPVKWIRHQQLGPDGPLENPIDSLEKPLKVFGFPLA